MNTFNLNLDLDKTSGLPQWVTLRQGDKSGTVVHATFYDHGAPLTGSYTARLCLRHPGTGDTYYRALATYSSGGATITVNEQLAATIPGVTTGYFELAQGSTVVASTADFGVRILRSALDGATMGETYDNAIQEAIDNANEAAEEAREAAGGGIIYSPPKLGFGYGTCSNTASNASKTVSITDYLLTEGGIVVVKFTNAVPASATLNVTSKGAKAIYYRGSAIVADVIKAGDTATFVYAGDYYHLLAVDRWGEGGSYIDGDEVSY